MSMLSSGSCVSGPDGWGETEKGYRQRQTTLPVFMTLHARGYCILSTPFWQYSGKASSRPSIHLSVCLSACITTPPSGLKSVQELSSLLPALIKIGLKCGLLYTRTILSPIQIRYKVQGDKKVFVHLVIKYKKVAYFTRGRYCRRFKFAI
jgi:hypothetical protein